MRRINEKCEIKHFKIDQNCEKNWKKKSKKILTASFHSHSSYISFYSYCKHLRMRCCIWSLFFSLNRITERKSLNQSFNVVLDRDVLKISFDTQNDASKIEDVIIFSIKNSKFLVFKAKEWFFLLSCIIREKISNRSNHSRIREWSLFLDQ